MALLHGLQGMSASKMVFALCCLDWKIWTVSDHWSAQGSVPCFFALFQSRLLGRLNCPQTSWGFEGKLGVAASIAWGLSCGHWLPLGSNKSLAKLQLSAWVSAQPWNGYLQQGRTFSPLGQWSARTQIGCFTPGVLQQWLYRKGEKKKKRPWGFLCCR